MTKTRPRELSDIGRGVGKSFQKNFSPYPRGLNAQNFTFPAEKRRFLPSVMGNAIAAHEGVIFVRHRLIDFEGERTIIGGINYGTFSNLKFN